MKRRSKKMAISNMKSLLDLDKVDPLFFLKIPRIKEKMTNTILLESILQLREISIKEHA